LAKKHFARLWYPEPGSGGDIPSRADYAMTRQQFDELFPTEFWREVVDRINQHMPQTLLLAEAFWLMEGYFVRTLGMHRVYNSAFMHMLKNEENNKYRKLLGNTLEFEPEILKRYVNFMSNPDEETAIRQFGTGDKYFGICTLMVTLPGLPMFSHGQAEGFAEKYGMEYQRAYMNETVNQWLMDKHIKEIFPLTKKRYLFSDVEHFNLYDFHDDAGFINENVFAFTNRKHNERALVLYNNKYESATGKFFRSVPKLIKGRANRPAATITLAEALAINANNRVFYTFREHFSGLEFLRTGYELATAGWHWRLNGFECRVFIDFAELTDHDGSLAALHSVLGGRGVPSIETERRKQWLWPVHESFEALIDPSHVDFVEAAIQGRNEATDIITDFEAAAQKLSQTISDKYLEYPNDNRLAKKLVNTINGLLRAGYYIRSNDNFFASFLKRIDAEPLHKLIAGRADRPAGEEAALLLMVLAIRVIGAGFSKLPYKSEPIDELMLLLPISSVLARYGRAFSDVEKDLELLRAICCYESVTCSDEHPEAEVQSKVSREKMHIAKSSLWFDNPKVRLWIGVNAWEGSTWFVKENFNQFCMWMFRLELIELCSRKVNDKQLQQAILAMLKEFTRIYQTAELSGYRFDRFLELLGAEK
ncbi:MAG TPA: alpha-amylase family protein, partial [Bacteroidales bacterium]|nr:alpha-amylase family protein [Bacteroidales bacterium]